MQEACQADIPWTNLRQRFSSAQELLEICGTERSFCATAFYV
jgi:hypothetical protein